MIISSFQGEYRWLSNFWLCNVEVGGITYPSVEHFYQAAKAVKISDMTKIATAATPSQAKWLGRNIQTRPDWEEVKVFIMRSGLEAKFRNPELARKLVATFPTDLVEGNYWHDNFWGNCSCPRCIDKPGKNVLGLLLMEIRDGLL